MARNWVQHKLSPEEKVLHKTRFTVEFFPQKDRYTGYRLNMTQLKKLEASISLAENSVLVYIKQATQAPSDISPRLLTLLAAIGDLDLLIRVENIYFETRQRLLQSNGKTYPTLAMVYRNTMRGFKCDSLRCPLFAAIFHRNDKVARHLICVSRLSKSELRELFSLIRRFIRTFEMHIPDETLSEAELDQVQIRLAMMLTKRTSPRR